MKKSRYFAELAESYGSEIDDLHSDSEGKTVLQNRLKTKRAMFKDILPMIEYSPEMVAVAFYGAFGFKEPALMAKTVVSEPGQPAFPSWDRLGKTLAIADWAQPLVKASLENEAGDGFLVTTASLEFLRLHGAATAQQDAADETENEARDEWNDEESDDLGTAGNDWMTSQGFDSLDT
jgi:hypothetical protein